MSRRCCRRPAAEPRTSEACGASRGRGHELDPAFLEEPEEALGGEIGLFPPPGFDDGVEPLQLGVDVTGVAHHQRPRSELGESTLEELVRRNGRIEGAEARETLVRL